MNIRSSQIRERIMNFYPEIEKFNLNLSTDFSEEKNAWIITLMKDGSTLFTHIDQDDAQMCIDDGKCVYFENQLMGFFDAYCSGSSACEV